jgi:uncharacterized membrane-anchored protein
MKQKIIDFLKSKEARTFYWQAANATLLFLIAACTFLRDSIDSTYALLFGAVIAGLNAVTKHINKSYL